MPVNLPSKNNLSTDVLNDLKFVWHPFTRQPANPPVNIVAAQGIYYIDENGKKYIDAISSWWVNLHGHSHPHLVSAISDQAAKNAHSIFSGFTHPQAVRLAERILQKLPGEMEKVFFSDDGSTAVEVGIKMALQYFRNRGETKTGIIAIENAYHGDTFGSMSVGARNVFTQAFSKLLFNVNHIPVPLIENRESCLHHLQQLLEDKNNGIFIYEPLVQGAGGMKMHDAEVVNELLNLCRQQGVLCIADEVMTGFGRTGTLFASAQIFEKPDIICLSKGLTGGVMPLGLTACRKFIYDAFSDVGPEQTFFHGHSFTGNPLACAAANASLDIFESENTIEKIKTIAESHQRFAEKLRVTLGDWEVRCKGTIIAFEYKNEKSGYLASAGAIAADFLFQHGILIRPLGNVFYLLPPYCITAEELQYIYSVIEKFYAEHA
jgi:adenosylmethionine---8-amino-7-oxononanoate aminotransferase